MTATNPAPEAPGAPAPSTPASAPDPAVSPTPLARLRAFAERAPWQVLSGTGLKWVAIVCMLVDHLAATLVWSHYLLLRQSFDPGVADMYDLYIWMRRIGRITFPIFCFVLVEGFTHTRSKPKYALRLLLFAIVSEIPYDYALHDQITYTSQLNVMFTLLLAFVAIWLADAVGARLKLPAWATSLLTVAALLGACVLAGDDLLDVSYHEYGIVLVGVLYLARACRPAQIVLGCLAAWWYCVEHGSWLQMWSVVGVAALALYNGKRGRGMKYFFYLFYPLHLLVLGLLKAWLF